jgi:hypothetical protein
LLRLEEIRFNHNTDSATGDALNLRLNQLPGTVVQGPEWRNGNETLPIAYAMRQAGPRVTVKAMFHGPPNRDVKVRARDATGFTGNKAGPVKRLALLVFRLLGVHSGAVLGEIADSLISFGSNGYSELIEFELRGHRIRQAGVGIYHVSWIWEYLEGRNWEPFARTEHKIYILVDEPREPWSREAPGPGQDNPTLAWVDALELACEWAAGATNQDEAARLITKRLNDNPLLFYDYDSSFISAWHSYLLSSFLDCLKRGTAFPVNCDDCASAVTSLSNLLGACLREGNIIAKFDGATTTRTLELRRVLLIGRDPGSSCDWQEDAWGYHEVSWLKTVGEDQYLYDGCLQLDLSEGSGRKPSPYLPAKMKFGEGRAHGYKHYLLKNDCMLDTRPLLRPPQ